ncbi:MAG: carboxy terminal-processing peptidase [Bacteroidota bacterium]|nr:carboxy terminal-processing peptidase [Bacteroidota bacterium]
MERINKPVRRYMTLFLAVGLAGVLASYTYCNRENKNQILLELVSQVLIHYHFSPLEINDDFSTKVYNLYLKRLDYNKRFFTKEDLKKLDDYKTKIDDEINNRSTEFYDVTNEMYNKNIAKVKAYYTEILEKPFTFDDNETYQTDPDKTDFPQDDAALKEAWRKSLKYQVLTRVNDALSAQELAKADTTPKKSVAELEADARKKVLKLQDTWFKRLGQLSDMDRFSIFLNAITGVYDPHTQYLAPEDKENFDMSMSGQLEGIGAQLQEDESGYTKVLSIVPGSPSYLQGDLKAGDKIMKVTQEKQDPVDIINMPISDVVKLIRGKKGTKVTLTVKKADGSVKNITITRDVVILEETFAKSALVDGPTGKIGYIYLPKFYQNFNDADGASCAEDVAKEVEKLKKENVGGIILDLRNNGGGALGDAVKMGGLFISQGPIVQVKTKAGAPNILKDTNPAIQYGGPLVVMVNSFSASASEILAAAMQDYHRAVIIGTTTFGKGTVQNQLNLDDFVPGMNQKIGPLGGMLVTIQKFYRINGGATQLKGVTPDIVLPDPFSEVETGEREQDYCMPWNKINPATYTTWTATPKMAQIIQKENVLVAADPNFAIIKEQAMELHKRKNETIITLNLEKYKLQEKEIQNKSKRFEELAKKDIGLKVHSLTADISKMDGDTAKIVRNTNWIKDLSRDLYLKEAVQVVAKIEKSK